MEQRKRGIDLLRIGLFRPFCVKAFFRWAAAVWPDWIRSDLWNSIFSASRRSMSW